MWLIVIYSYSFDADMDDMDEDEPVDDIENPEVLTCKMLWSVVTILVAFAIYHGLNLCFR